MRDMKRFIPFLNSDPIVPVLRLSGAISASAWGGGMNDQTLAPMIEKTFARGKVAAVALAINAPGGSPAQSSLIASRIRRLATEKEIPVHAFVEDIAASGGYWLACAADHIWVDANSIVGSIGVISSSFGLHGAIERFGIERRVHTAGKDKSMLDPFRPERAEDVERLKHLQATIHDTFIAHVKARRGDRLSTDDDLFTGDFWIGQRGVDLGLADGTAHLAPKMRELYGDKVKFVSMKPRRGVFQRFGANLGGGLITGVEDRVLWARYGLS